MQFVAPKNMKVKILVFILLSSLIFSFSPSQTLAAGDWPMFRKDPLHTGYSAEETSLNPPLKVKWKAPGGSGPNSPAVAEGIVYIKISGVLFARDAITGHLIWSKNTPAYDHSSVAVAYGMVFDSTACNNCGITAYDAKTGEEKWHLYFPIGTRGPNVDNGVVYLGSDDHYVRAVNAYTGQLIWTSPYLNDGVVAVPAISEGKVFVGTWGGILYALNAANGQIVWQVYTLGVTFSSPSVVDSVVYIGSGIQNVYAFNSIDGSLKWKYTDGTDSVWGSPGIAYGNVYIQDLAGRIHALDSNNGNLIWSYQTGALPSSSYSSPAIANGIVYIGSQDKKTYALDAYTGNIIWSYETGGSINSSPAISNGMLFIGSNDGYIYAFENERATPSPTPTPTPSPSPSPTSIPVTKVFVVPGFGASWNANAFASCSFDNDPNHWSLASYAESVYTPLLTALSSSGWDTRAFYYDWRQEIPINSSTLANTISNNTLPNEKANLVGHSMGGLVSREYLENSSGVKLNKFLTAGSPHMGVPQAYPAWSGGDIWQDNFITKIAMTLFLKHCAGLFSNDRIAVQQNVPSINNVLPIFDYLKSVKTGIFKSWINMLAKNNWHSDNNFDPRGVTAETMSGYGYSTLQNIQIKDPSKHDINLGNWFDGKPAGKIYSTDGDGTVLAASSILPGVTNVPLNQTHSGLVASVDGMTEILSFLGTPPTTLSSTFIEPNSALVIIGYPSNFWITDQNGKTKKDKNGMISLMNPKPGKYKISLLPQSDNTLFVVAQFLPNGQILYKEYHLKSLLPKFKTLKFDPSNPREDILN